MASRLERIGLSPDNTRHVTITNSIAITVTVTVLVAIVIAVRAFVPIGVDWQGTFATLPDVWRNPYANEMFTNPPWIIALLPHAWLPLSWGNAINFVLNIAIISALIIRYKGGVVAFLLTFTSPMMIELLRTGNVDWIPALAFLLPPMWGLPLLFIKPQVLGGAALIWWKRSGYSIRMFVPLVILLLISIAIWGLWMTVGGLPDQAFWWNFAPFPLGIPLGIYLLVRAFREDDEIMAAGSTAFLVPYFASYSLVPLMALLSTRYPRAAFVLYIGFWWFLVVHMRRFGTEL